MSYLKGTPGPDFEARIRERAYQLWQSEGCPHGRDLAHWHRAHQELSAMARQPHFPVPVIAEKHVPAVITAPSAPKARARIGTRSPTPKKK